MNGHDTKDTEQNLRIIGACHKKVASQLTEHGNVDNISDGAKMAFLLASIDILVSSTDSTQVRELHFAIGQLRHWGFGR